MKLSFSTLICPAWSLDEILQAATTHKMHGIDFRGISTQIDITRLPEFNKGLAKTRKRLAAADLALPCFNTSIVLVSPADDRWQMMLDECQRYAELAAATQTPLLRVFGGRLPKGVTRGEGLTLARRHLRQLVKAATARNVRIGVETHDDWSTSAQLLPLLEPFNPSQVGVIWDIEHSWRQGESPRETAKGLRPWIVHAHIKDSVMRDGTRLPTFLGAGELPLNDFLDALRSIGYEGWITLETEKRWNADAPDPELSLPDFERFMRHHGGEN